MCLRGCRASGIRVSPGFLRQAQWCSLKMNLRIARATNTRGIARMDGVRGSRPHTVVARIGVWRSPSGDAPLHETLWSRDQDPFRGGMRLTSPGDDSLPGRLPDCRHWAFPQGERRTRVRVGDLVQALDLAPLKAGQIDRCSGHR